MGLKAMLTTVNYYYYYIRLTAFFQDNLGTPAPEKEAILDFTWARDDGVAVASAAPYANHLHLDCQNFMTQLRNSHSH